MKFDKSVFNRASAAVWLRWMRAKKLKMADIDFRHANFYGADFGGANFNGADFHCANFNGADFGGANFNGADFYGADFRHANFYGADFRCADFHWADFHCADFRCADFGDASFRCANFYGADLVHADFRDANLGSADFGDTALCPRCPAEGSFVGFKKIAGKIVKLQITERAKRSSATTHKCRCSEARVISIDDGRMSEITNRTSCIPPLTYAVGKLVRPDSFDDDRWNECSHGIHFFISRHDAEMY